MTHTILLIEDNPNILKINRTALEMRGKHVLEAKTLEQGRNLLAMENPDLIILDILLPDGNGLKLCEEIRATSGVPILFLSALGENCDVINGLVCGGDDYLPKPYDLNVLLVRVDALLRRTAPKDTVLHWGRMTFETISQRAMIDGEDMLLTPKEFAMLLYLVQNRKKDLTAERLYEAVWGQPMGADANAVRVVVSRLRDKINPAGFQIEAVRGRGYRFTGI